MHDQRPLVLHVIHHLVIGGLENGLVNLISRMPLEKYRHAVACIEDFSDFRDRIQRQDVEVIALHRSQAGHWPMRRRLYALCRRLRPAILHSRNQSALDAIVPARLAGVRHCIHGEHGWDVHDLDGRRWKPAMLRRLHSPFVERYITVSQHLQRYLVERVGIRPTRIDQIYNGVDTDRFRPSPITPVAGMPKDFRADNRFLIGSVGRVQPVKDHATLVRAFSWLLSERPELKDRLRLAIVGGGPLLDDLRRLAAELHVDRWTWFPGPLHAIPEILRSFDVFVLPSLNEGISNTILEAMASGIPVLATAAGGNTELVEDHVSGRLFQPGDAGALGRLLLDYVRDPATCKNHGRTARNTALAKFSLDTMVNRYESVYDEVLRHERTH